MQNEIIQLKQKVKNLQKQLCDRTRNYLYHFKKSPIKKYHNFVESQTQTDITSFVQQQTQVNQVHESHFENVNIDEFNRNGFVEGKASQEKQQTKTDSTLLFNQQTQNLNQQRNQFKPNILISTQNHQNQIKSITQEIQNMKNQLQSNKMSQNIMESKFQFLSIPSQCKTPIKESDNTEFSKKKQFQTVSDLSQSKFNGQSSMISTIQQQHNAKQIKILKKQIKKLKNHLQTQILVSSQTKNALLISEQENYKFRLQIQKLNKQIQILNGVFNDYDTQNPKAFSFQDDEPIFKSVDSDQSQSTKQELEKFRSQTEKYEEHISILEGVKRQYLKRCIEAKEEICRLKQEIQLIKSQNRQLKSLLKKRQEPKESLEVQNDTKCVLLSQKTWSDWSEILRSKIHEISNCLPLIGNHEQFLFKPDSIEDVLSMLERILKFCKNIESWEKQRIQCIEKQRANLLKILSSLLVKHPDSKQTIAQEILEIQELKYLVNFMNKQPKSASRSHQDLSLEQVLAQTNQSDPVETN